MRNTYPLSVILSPIERGESEGQRKSLQKQYYSFRQRR